MANFENISIEKGMYQTKGKSLTDVLETLDPSANYQGTALEGLDAFGRQLKRFDIKVSGKGSDCVEKFFQSSNSAALFPEYVSRAVKQGMEQADIIPEIVATVTNIDGMDYRSIASVPSEDDKTLKVVAEGASIPQTVVKTQENLVKLHKRGRMLVSSYEALRFQRLDLFTVTLNQIGAYIRRAQLKDAVDVLLNGDGNDNPCGVISAEVSGNIDYKDLLKLWAELSPYELNTILAPTDAMQTILSMEEMKDSNAGLNFQGTGKMVSPLGATLLHTPSIPSGKIIGIDKNCALEMVQAGDIVTDYDKLIDRQLERAAISCTAGFAKIFTESSKALSY
ncbi:MAG: phage major capsid protein [Ruminococcus sp.]